MFRTEPLQVLMNQFLNLAQALFFYRFRYCVSKEKPQKGSIVAVGPGTKENPVTVKVGDSVLYGKYSGTDLKLDSKNYLIMRESDILAIV